MERIPIASAGSQHGTALALGKGVAFGHAVAHPSNGTGGSGHRVAGREHGFDVVITRGETRVELPSGVSIAA
jgi:hypothetical protein